MDEPDTPSCHSSAPPPGLPIVSLHVCLPQFQIGFEKSQILENHYTHIHIQHADYQIKFTSLTNLQIRPTRKILISCIVMLNGLIHVE